MAANDMQVGGAHYAGEYQHWDFVIHAGLNYFTGNITKYTARWRKKGGPQDLKKAMHYALKYREYLETARPPEVQIPKFLRMAAAVSFCKSHGLEPAETHVMMLCAGLEGPATVQDMDRVIYTLNGVLDAEPSAGYVGQ